jgi:serine/threonine protein kinase
LIWYKIVENRSVLCRSQPENASAPYEILVPIGKGGMGEVYRAKNTKHRDVAIKILPESFAQDSERLAPV